MSFTLAIVGRPNVGKSTLFNRLVGKKIALVDDQPGVTRDLREGEGKLGDIKFTVIDTAGLEDAQDESLQGRMRALTEHAVEISDICLFMIDARAGVTYMDQTLATILRKNAKNVLLVANKSEGSAGDAGTIEAWGLGLGEPISISSEHGEGMSDLLHALMPLADRFDSAKVLIDEPVKVVDKRCQRKYGHTNWARMGAVSDEVLSKNSYDYDEAKGIVYFHRPITVGE